MFGFGFSTRRRPGTGSATPPTPAFVPPTGYQANGAGNAALKAMIARVKAGTGRGRIVWKGDSTTVGQGGGTTADAYGLTNARANRPPAVLASLLSAAGIAAFDNGVTGNNGLDQAGGGPSLPVFDPRVSLGSPAWQLAGGLDFAGGNFLTNQAGAFTFTPTTDVDRFEVDVYNSNAFTLAFLVDGAAPATVSVVRTSGTNAGTVAGSTLTIPAPGSGFTRVGIAAAATGSHTVSFTSTSAATAGAVRGVVAYASDTPAIDMVVHAACGAAASHQAASGGGWSNNDALAFDAPDLTIINCGLNDMAGGRSTAAYAADLQTMITTAKLSGDVLLMVPHPAAPSVAPLATQAAFNTAARNVAASNGVALFSLFDHYGGAFDTAFAARMFDGIVHPAAQAYAEFAALDKAVLQAMNGGSL